MLLLRCDTSYSPLKQGVADVTVCDHALQHISDHKLGFSSLAKATRRDGLVCICVYSWEHNFLMTRIVEPMKVIMHKFPLRVQRAVSFFPAALIFLMIHLVYVPFNRFCQRVAKALPLFEHMMFWSRNTFDAVWISCFDLMHAPVSYHFRRDEIESLAAINHLDIVTLVNTHNTLWSLVAKKKETADGK
jgi:hypothetical protein